MHKILKTNIKQNYKNNKWYSIFHFRNLKCTRSLKCVSNISLFFHALLSLPLFPPLQSLLVPSLLFSCTVFCRENKSCNVTLFETNDPLREHLIRADPLPSAVPALSDLDEAQVQFAAKVVSETPVIIMETKIGRANLTDAQLLLLETGGGHRVPYSSCK